MFTVFVEDVQPLNYTSKLKFISSVLISSHAHLLWVGGNHISWAVDIDLHRCFGLHPLYGWTLVRGAIYSGLVSLSLEEMIATA